MEINYSKVKMSPPQMLVFGFIILIGIGTVFLMLPYSTTGEITLTDALFTSTSAVCVTGLIVKNTSDDFTLFGKIVILFLIQIGGLGYMSMATFLALLAGKRLGITERILIKESLNIATLEGIIKFMKGMLVFVLLTEGVGILVFYAKFSTDPRISGGFLYAIFHSISAFNNAGFSLFSDNLMRYRNDVIINLTVMALIILGGIGFTVVDDVYRRLKGQVKVIMLHTRIVLLTTIFLIVAGAVLFYITERRLYFTELNFSMGDSMLSSLFASVTARTAGFNTVDYSRLQPATIFLTIILMIIGGSPGSTAGGVKTTTFSVIMIHLWNTIRGRTDTVVFNKRIPGNIISKSYVILSIAIFYVTFMTFIIIELEHTPFQKTMFEVVSAFGTVGLSPGDGDVRSFSASFSDISKWIIILTMLAGRLGPLTLFMAITEQKEERVRYPEGRVMIG
jgi:trk system potassium uptake protein TrkH